MYTIYYIKFIIYKLIILCGDFNIDLLDFLNIFVNISIYT